VRVEGGRQIDSIYLSVLVSSPPLVFNKCLFFFFFFSSIRYGGEGTGGLGKRENPTSSSVNLLY